VPCMRRVVPHRYCLRHRCRRGRVVLLAAVPCGAALRSGFGLAMSEKAVLQLPRSAPLAEGIAAPVNVGVMPSQRLRDLISQGHISSERTFGRSQIQPASLDLRLGEYAHSLRCSFLPDDQTVAEKLSRFEIGRVDLRDGAILERNRPYLIPLLETVALPRDLSARANPKSSTGRLDIFTRVVTDYSHRFDDVAAGYKGDLWLEVVSRSFTVKVRTGLALNQLRVMRGTHIGLRDNGIREQHVRTPLLYEHGRAFTAKELPLGGGLFLSLALAEHDGSRVGWRAKKNSALLDLERVGVHDARDFWEPVRPERGGGIILEPEEFYLLLSREAVRVPPDLACEMTAYDPTSGELRTHYAGFFDPGFGHRRTKPGSRAALEVRAHDVPFMVEDGQRICKLVFEPMAETSDTLYGEGSHYQFQEQTLSKHFTPEPRASLGLARQVAGVADSDSEGGPGPDQTVLFEG